MIGLGDVVGWKTLLRQEIKRDLAYSEILYAFGINGMARLSGQDEIVEIKFK